MFIYLIVNHETGKYYVGQHTGNNLKKYLQQKFSDARHGRGGNSRLYNSMRKHPFTHLWSIHALRSDIQAKAELDETERDFIKFLRAQDPEYGYNLCRGGEGFTGLHSSQTCAKMSEGVKRAWANPEKRAKQSANLKADWAKPESFSNRVQAIRDSWADPYSRSNRMKAFENLDFHSKMSTVNKKTWSDPERRKKQAALQRERWTNPEYRAKMSNLAKNQSRGTGQKFVEALPLDS